MFDQIEIWFGQADNIGPTWRLRLVYSEGGTYNRLYAKVNSEDEGIAKAVELRMKGFDVWQLETWLEGTTIARTIKMFNKE